MRRAGITMGIIVVATVMPCGLLAADPCLTARPAPQCRACFVTEFGYDFKVTAPLKRRTFSAQGDSITATYENPISGRHLITSELGVMYNIGRDHAVGFTHFIGWDAGHRLFGGVKLRGRRWLSERSSVDVSAGALLWGIEGEGFEKPGFIAGASWNVSSWQSVDLTVTSMESKPWGYAYYDSMLSVAHRTYSPGQREVAVYLGHRIASKPGLVVNGAALLTTGVVLGIWLALLRDSN